MTLDKTYNPHALEQHWYKTWEENHYFQPQGKGDPYCIMLPPPNVTGSLHMGHGFGFTLIDVLIRHARMSGKNTLWQGGTDHAGIATQMVVERRLAAAGKDRKSIGRDAFTAEIWQWKEESGGSIVRQLRRLGASIDWQREKFTMDEDLSYAVREVFIRLFEEGLIYRGKRLVNWDPVLLTAISDLEVVNQPEEGSMWHIRYPLEEGGSLMIATTRPETLLGDTAVAVHPDDSRYTHLIGKKVQLPLTDRLIPIIADEYVDPLFGTGCVKITPAHDFNDYAVGLRHQLEPINILTPTATLNDNAPKAYQGLDRFAARKKIVEDLDRLGLLEKIDKHTLNVPRGDRSHAVIEPYLTYQWYVKSKPLAEPALKAVQDGKVRFIPENWNKTYFQWMNNIEDWCISRQLWWGHRIPVWYDDQGKAFVGHDEAEVRQRHQLSPDVLLTQDEDVLDTWFSSALWPFSSLGWPHNTSELKTFFPTQVLVTGFDIIFFWVARMIMMSLKFTKEIPFKEVYITGLIRDAEGHKMSKTKGNVLDPIDLMDGIGLQALIEKRTYGLMQPAMQKKIEKNTTKEFPEGIQSFGCDALRFTFCSVASYTREIRFDVNRLSGYRNFCNKLWNAARFVLMNTEDKAIEIDPSKLTVADYYILAKLHDAIAEAEHALSLFRFDLFAQALYNFTWYEFCDWYVEMTKIMLNDDSLKEQHAAIRGCLITVLETLLRLLHPLIPFITEAIWQKVAPLAGIHKPTIMLADYPTTESYKSYVSKPDIGSIDWLKQLVIAIRTIRSEMNVPPGKKIKLWLAKGNEADKHNASALQAFISNLAKVETIEWIDHTPSDAATTVVGELQVYLPLEGIINQEEENIRLNKEINKLQKDLEVITRKLDNKQFIERAPQEVVEKERERFAALSKALEKLSAQVKLRS